jgi:NADPH2:quinone reductase
MRAMRAETFSGYEGLKLIDLPKPAVTNLIVPQASIRGLNMFAQPQAAIIDAWSVIVSLLKSGAIKPIVARTLPLEEAAGALRYLVEGRPFGRVVLTI